MIFLLVSNVCEIQTWHSFELTNFAPKIKTQIRHTLCIYCIRGEEITLQKGNLVTQTFWLKIGSKVKMVLPPCTQFFPNLLPENNYELPSRNFEKNLIYIEKGDEISRFDGTVHRVAHPSK
jgi:hypothetical protein